jgi:flagellar biogenesis protein FliO
MAAASWTLPRQEGWAVALLRRMSGLVKVRTGIESPLRIEGRISLGPKKSLVLVDCRGREILLAVSGDTVTPLMELPAARRVRKAKP